MYQCLLGGETRPISNYEKEQLIIDTLETGECHFTRFYVYLCDYQIGFDNLKEHDAFVQELLEEFSKLYKEK